MSPASCHVLIIDDEPAVLSLVSSAIRKLGVRQISTCSSISGARQCWHAQMGNFDLVISDFSFPDGCSTAFIKEFLRSKATLRVILITGFAAGDLDLDPSFTRNVSVLQKPFRTNELVDAVSESLKTIAPRELTVSTAAPLG